jgi:hypothetical protein
VGYCSATQIKLKLYYTVCVKVVPPADRGAEATRHPSRGGARSEHIVSGAEADLPASLVADLRPVPPAELLRGSARPSCERHAVGKR